MSSYLPSVPGVALGALWPVRNVVNMASASAADKTHTDEAGAFSGGTLKPYPNAIGDFLGVQFGSLPKMLIAVVCWHVTAADWGAAAAGYDLSPTGWVARIVLRDLVLMVLVAGVWDWLLYRSPLQGRLAPYKFNKDYPDAAQLSRDVFWTTSATLLASAQEAVLMHWWTTGRLFKQLPLQGAAQLTAEDKAGAAPAFFGTEWTNYYIAWTVTMLYWRIAHFYVIHRGMHPWWDRKNGLAQLDVGAFLYRHVHSLHHKSYNPTAWSGLSMHPVESTAYLSAALTPLFFRCGMHPWLHLYTKIDLIIGAQIGHDGFDAPGGGSYYHQLHHGATALLVPCACNSLS